jgi:hypothetical protein
MGLEDDPDLKPTCGVEDGYAPMADECESAGRRVVNQKNSYRQFGWWFPGCDLEQDDCDREDDDPDEAKRQSPEMCPCD